MSRVPVSHRLTWNWGATCLLSRGLSGLARKQKTNLELGREGVAYLVSSPALRWLSSHIIDVIQSKTQKGRKRVIFLQDRYPSEAKRRRRILHGKRYCGLHCQFLTNRSLVTYNEFCPVVIPISSRLYNERVGVCNTVRVSENIEQIFEARL